MRAVGYTELDPARGADVLVDLDVPEPEPRPHDLTVRVRAMAVNPRDIKVRLSEQATPDRPRILGWDAAGVVVAVGDAVSGFAVGDEVYYAGDASRPGCNSELHVVDERITGHKPAGLDFEEAAALPLTALTAYEMLFDRLGVEAGEPAGRRLLVLGGAGGVPSMAIQLARRLTGLEVIATASRPESREWVRRMGAHRVVDHSRPLTDQLEPDSVDLVFSTHTDGSVWGQLAALVAPQGRIGLIDNPEPVDLVAMKMKSVSIHWEVMFTRSMYETADIARQREILDHVARLADDGTLTSTLTERIGPLSAENLRRAHRRIEDGHVIGKLTLAGLPD